MVGLGRCPIAAFNNSLFTGLLALLTAKSHSALWSLSPFPLAKASHVTESQIRGRSQWTASRHRFWVFGCPNQLRNCRNFREAYRSIYCMELWRRRRSVQDAWGFAPSMSCETVLIISSSPVLEESCDFGYSVRRSEFLYWVDVESILTVLWSWL
jgi:hypothetical protein